MGFNSGFKGLNTPSGKCNFRGYGTSVLLMCALLVATAVAVLLPYINIKFTIFLNQFT